MLRVVSDTKKSSRFGAPLREQIDALSAMGEELAEVAGEAHAPLAYDAIEGLQRQTVKIAFVGQVKAGKSTLINSFTRMVGFLPADVNPWTAVVTSLHFGRPQARQLRARFRFFLADEWDRLASRGGKLGELNELVLSGYNRDELEDQLEVMKTRARRRLGEQFYHLLGKEHRFNDISGDILRRYVCAGEMPTEPVRGSLEGRFSDITKSADMYFDAGPFAIPVTMIDTPGTNDIFLVREEITCQVLEHADLHVVVMSAHQALATSDLGLMRMLYALDRGRMIVFVNRVDELADPATEAPLLKAHVKRMLARDFPGQDVPVIVGSGWWGELGQIENGTIPARETQKLRAFANYLQQEGVAVRQGVTLAENCSGLPQLSDTLYEMVANGPGKTWVQSATTALANIARAAKSGADLDVKAFEEALHKARSERGSVAEQRLRLAAQGKQVEALANRLEESMERWKRKLGDAGEKNWNDLRVSLEGALEHFVEAETQSLRDASGADGKSRVWTCDPTNFRRELHRDFLNGFSKSRQALIDILKASAAETHSLLVEFGAAEGDLLENLEEIKSVTPSAAPLAKIVAFDMEFSWWKEWWRIRSTMDARSESLAKIIRVEFRPIIEELLENGSLSLTKVSKIALDQFYGLHRSAIDMAKRRAKQIAEMSQRLETAGSDAVIDEMVAAEKEHIANRNADSKRLASMAEALEQMSLENTQAPEMGFMA